MLDNIVDFILRLFMDVEDNRHRKEMPEIERIEEENRGLDPKKMDLIAKIILIASSVVVVAVILVALITR